MPAELMNGRPSHDYAMRLALQQCIDFRILHAGSFDRIERPAETARVLERNEVWRRLRSASYAAIRGVLSPPVLRLCAKHARVRYDGA